MFPKYIFSAVFLLVVYTIICQAAPPGNNATRVNSGPFRPSQGAGGNSQPLVKPQGALAPIPKSATSSNSTTIVNPQHQRVGRSIFNGTSHISAESDEEERDDLSSETAKPKNPLFRPLGLRPAHPFNRTSTTVQTPSIISDITSSETNRPIAENQKGVHALKTSSEVDSPIVKRSPSGQAVFATTGSSTTGNTTTTHLVVGPAAAHH